MRKITRKPTAALSGNICSCHGKDLKLFCRTDQKCTCLLCAVYEHKHHGMILASEERSKWEGELVSSQQKIKKRIQDRENDMKVLQHEMDAINYSADKALKESEEIFTQLLHLINNMRSDVKLQIKSQQKTKVSRAKELRAKLQQELRWLRRRDAELEQLSHRKDHAKEKLHTIFTDTSTKISLIEKEVSVSPKTRAEFLKFSTQLTLDPDTVNTRMLLSEENRRATFVSKKQAYPGHPERFMNRSQVLSRESLTGRHYWEVEWSGSGMYVAVAYKSIMRTGDESEFGNNDNSWALRCSSSHYELSHKRVCEWFSGPQSSRIGVYLSHTAGVLSFYSVSDTMILLHRVQATFTQPLYAGLRAYHFLGADLSAVFSELEQMDTVTE
uniref:B30.2/SPRY domain-containing protein n=1 Tax=Maylandia zebra TaxID=106582 RepID=A0A3P9CAB5_9CICH